MNTEEILSKAIAGVINQGCKSATLGGGEDICKYRGDNNAKCAVGHLIDDEHYSECLECLPVSACCVLSAVESSLGRPLYDEEEEYLFYLQQCHDSACTGTHFIEHFKLNIKQFVCAGDLPDYCLEFL